MVSESKNPVAMPTNSRTRSRALSSASEIVKPARLDRSNSALAARETSAADRRRTSVFFFFGGMMIVLMVCFSFARPRLHRSYSGAAQPRQATTPTHPGAGSRPAHGGAGGRSGHPGIHRREIGRAHV